MVCLKGHEPEMKTIPGAVPVAVTEVFQPKGTEKECGELIKKNS